MSAEGVGLALGIAFAAGLNVYATVATLGILHHLGLATLPPTLLPVAHPVVLGIAVALYVVEFVADKVPFVDNVWDLIHTFIRPPAAAVMAYAAVAGVPEPWRIAAALVAGGVALTSHGTKAGARAAVNTSPEPVSNSFLSAVEDALAIGLAWLAATHPVIAIVAVLILLAGAVWVLAIVVRLLQRVFGTSGARTPRGAPPGATADD